MGPITRRKLRGVSASAGSRRLAPEGEYPDSGCVVITVRPQRRARRPCLVREVGETFGPPALEAAASEDDLKAHVKAHLAGYKAPREVEFLAELPRNATGKILKRELQARETEKST